MKDILGREVNQGDLVVVKATGRHGSFGIGVWHGKSVRFLNGSSATYGSCFKVVNPTEEEAEIRDSILSTICVDEEIKNMKPIPKKELEVGRLYVNKSGQKVWYLGEGELTRLYSSDFGETWLEEMWSKSGVGFLTANYHGDGTDIGVNHKTLGAVGVRKTNPQLVQALDEKIDLSFQNEYSFLDDRDESFRYRYKTIIKILDYNIEKTGL